MRYRPADEQICEVLRAGRNLATNIADDTGLSRQYVSNRLGELAEAGHVKNVGNGLYELVEEPDWSEMTSDDQNH
jgi:predicted transcriptional regulator